MATIIPKSENEAKCDQMMMEALQQMCEVIVQSRVDLGQPTAPEKKLPKFNLTVREVPYVRETLAGVWGAQPVVALGRPITLDVFWQELNSPTPSDGVLLEKWELCYKCTGVSELQHRTRRRSIPGQGERAAHETNQSLSQAMANQEVLSQLRRVFKRVTVVLRTLYSYTRMLPAHQLHRRATSTLSVPKPAERLGVLLYCPEDQMAEDTGGLMGFSRDKGTSGGVIETLVTSISTPFGDFHLNLQYLQNVDFKIQVPQPAIIDSKLIIQNYVGDEHVSSSDKHPLNLHSRSDRYVKAHSAQYQGALSNFSQHSQPLPIPGLELQNTGYPPPGSRSFWLAKEEDLKIHGQQHMQGIRERDTGSASKGSMPADPPTLVRVYSRSADSYSPLQAPLTGSPSSTRMMSEVWSVPYGLRNSEQHLSTMHKKEVASKHSRNMSAESPASRKTSTSESSNEPASYRKYSCGTNESGDEGLVPATPPFTYSVAQMSSPLSKYVLSSRSSPPFPSIPLYLLGASQFSPPPLALNAPLKQVCNEERVSLQQAGLSLTPLPDSPFQTLDHSCMLQSSVFKEASGLSVGSTSMSANEEQDDQKMGAQDLPFSLSDSTDDIFNISAGSPTKEKEPGISSMQKWLKATSGLDLNLEEMAVSLGKIDDEIAEFERFGNGFFQKCNNESYRNNCN